MALEFVATAEEQGYIARILVSANAKLLVYKIQTIINIAICRYH